MDLRRQWVERFRLDARGLELVEDIEQIQAALVELVDCFLDLVKRFVGRVGGHFYDLSVGWVMSLALSIGWRDNCHRVLCGERGRVGQSIPSRSSMTAEHTWIGQYARDGGRMGKR